VSREVAYSIGSPAMDPQGGYTGVMPEPARQAFVKKNSCISSALANVCTSNGTKVTGGMPAKVGGSLQGVGGHGRDARREAVVAVASGLEHQHQGRLNITYN